MLMHTLHGELAVAWSELKTSFMLLVRFSNHLLCARYLQCPHFGSSAVILNEFAQNCELFLFFLVEKPTQGMEKIIAVKKNSAEKSSNLPHIYLNHSSCSADLDYHGTQVVGGDLELADMSDSDTRSVDLLIDDIDGYERISRSFPKVSI